MEDGQPAGDPERDADLEGQPLTEADRRLIAVYGDIVHRNDGRHLHGGVADDEAMCALYDRLVAHTRPLYDAPKGKVGARFVGVLAKELRAVRQRTSNSERPMMLAAAVLRRDHNSTRAKDIRRRIDRRLDLWEEGKVEALVEDAIATAMRGAGRPHREETDDTVARRFDSLIGGRKYHAAVRALTNRSGGGLLGVEEADTKSGRPVIEVQLV